MAQTTRKRQTKHRGNAAGVVESRGRTGRKPTAAEKSGKAARPPAARSRSASTQRDRPPTWRGAFCARWSPPSLLLLICVLVLKPAPASPSPTSRRADRLHADQLLHRQLALQAPPAQARRSGGGGKAGVAMSAPDVRSFTVGAGAGELLHRARRRRRRRRARDRRPGDEPERLLEAASRRSG